MYTVRFVRTGKSNHLNFSHTRGRFTKQFKTLSELAKYLAEAQNIFIDSPRQLKHKEYQLLAIKLSGLIHS